MHSTDLDQGTLPAPLRALLNTWRGLGKPGALPAFADLRMHRLVEGNDTLALAEVLRDGDGTITDFRILFISTGLRSDVSPNLVGRTFSDLPGQGPETGFWRAFATCADTGLPIRASFDYIGGNPAFSRTCDILLPIGGTQGTAQYVLCGVVFLP